MTTIRLSVIDTPALLTKQFPRVRTIATSHCQVFSPRHFDTFNFKTISLITPTESGKHQLLSTHGDVT